MGALTQTTAELQDSVDHIFPTGSGVGLKVDTANPDRMYRDLKGVQNPIVGSPTISPTRELWSTAPDIYGMAYDLDDETDLFYHIDHDWALNTDAFFHIHWGHTGTAITGTFTVEARMTYGSRDGVVSAGKTLAPVTVVTTDIATTPASKHYVTEVNLCTETPTAAEFDRSDMEIDGAFMSTFKVTGLPTVTGGHLFIATADIHYLSTGIGTKSRAAPFYT